MQQDFRSRYWRRALDDLLGAKQSLATLSLPGQTFGTFLMYFA